MDISLAQAVERYAARFQALSEAELDRPWAWGAYDSEGVRFAMFRTLEELRELAVIAHTERAMSGPQVRAAQRILAQYHVAYRDLDGLFLGTEDITEQAPAEGQWSLLEILRHIVEADIEFFGVAKYAIEQHRSGNAHPEKPPMEFWDANFGDEATFNAQINVPFGELRAFHATIHDRILTELADISDAELELPSRYWEGYALSLRFRLHRFESHMRQHTIQADKALVELGYAPNEAKRLLRLIYAGLAEAEGATIGAPGAAAGQRAIVVSSISARTDELAGILE